VYTQAKFNSSVLKSTLAIVLGCALGVAPAFAATEARTPAVGVFGDSLSDSGNAFALVGGTNTPPDYSVDFFLVPDQPYARGGHHFTNGPTWVEQYAKSKGLAANVQPAFRSAAAGAANYAVGAARARDDGSSINFARQVERFLQDVGSDAPASSLYVVEIGSNDIRDCAAMQDPNIVSDALAAIESNVNKLYGAGARTFLVWNVPKVAVTPAIRNADAAFPGTAWFIDTQVNVPYNDALDGLLGQLRQSLPGVKIIRFDAYAQTAAIYDNGAGYGLSIVDAPCIDPKVPPYFCQAPDDYFFWDGVHPTAAVHSIFASAIAQLLGQ
jgi:phospholipase/lecithinase/hemolysin